MNQQPTVHRWTTKSEYYDIENGEEISKQLALRDYNILKKRKRIKIENYHGYITIENECERKKQLKIQWKEK